MNKLRFNPDHKKGFTIIELLVVIAVLGILITISIVAYGSWHRTTVSAQVKSDLNGIAAAMEGVRSANNGYPTTLPTNFTPSLNVTLTPNSADASSTTYCINGTSTDDATVFFYIAAESKDKGPQVGTCAGRTSLAAPTKPTALAVTSTTSSQIGLSWGVGGGATSYTMQCATDGAYVSGVVEATSTGLTGTVTGLSIALTYYCHVKATNSNGSSAYTNSVTATTILSFGTVPAATGLTESVPGPTSSTFAWSAITCSLGTPSYRFVWVSPYVGTGSWGSATSAVMANDQATLSTWKVETKCTYSGVDSSISTSANRSFTMPVADPAGAFGTIGWDDRFAFNAGSNTYVCAGSAVEQYQLVSTLINYTTSTISYGWSASATQSVTGVTQGSRMTTYMQIRCYYNSVSSNVASSGSRTDNASVDAPGGVPGWCAGTCGSPKGDRWSAVGCPAGTYAVYWAYAVGDYSNAIWGAYEAAGFFGYDRGSYSYGNTMVNDYLMARCTSDFRTSAYGPQGYARY
jgi:prepilin-type N-terminal cleavage/methylation domain-containing protein